MSAIKVFSEEGGTQEDVDPTRLLLVKLLKMGWPRIGCNEESERIDYRCVMR